MKTFTTFAIAIAFIFSTQSIAKADRSDRALIGGIIGGVVIASILDDDCHDGRSKASYHKHHRNDSHRGYYKRVSYRTWVPGHWSIRYDNCGQKRKTYVRGHYEQTYKKVWVSSSRKDDYNNKNYYRERKGERDSRNERRDDRRDERKDKRDYHARR
ncbi:hypothetical protein MLD52_19925 [Puniceicoccaceae bacterium K14]|nr:hypothetical protein [Puniceicoccaceae bacterium K14]